MKPDAEFDLVVYGASGFTGRLVAEHLAGQYGVAGPLRWAMAGRSIDKLAAVRDEIGAPPQTPLVVADASEPASLFRMLARTKAVVTTVGPYQTHGTELLHACAHSGTDYLDLCGEPDWMRGMIDDHEAAARELGARILFSCGFDSIPFELGVYFTQGLAKASFGGPVRRVNARVRAIKGGLSGGTVAAARATLGSLLADRATRSLMADPFALTPGFVGPDQPCDGERKIDPDLGLEVGPFMMATINTKNVHRSNLLQGHPYGADFVYHEMAVVTPGAPTAFSDIAAIPLIPGEGPSREDRETGFFDLTFIGVAADGRKVRDAVRGDRDPGYGSTSKMIAETAICLAEAGAALPGGVWTPGAALGQALIDRLGKNAGLTFKDETEGAERR